MENLEPQATGEHNVSEISVVRNAFANFKEGGKSVEELEQQMVDMLREASGHEGTLKRRLEKYENDFCGLKSNATDVTAIEAQNETMASTLLRLLESEEFAVIRVNDNKQFSMGRIDFNSNQNRFDQEMRSKDYDLLIRERDQLREDAQKSHEVYAKLYEAYTLVRNTSNEFREHYNDAAEKLKKARQEIEDVQQKYARLRENAATELERASRDYAQLMKDNEEGTMTLRLKNEKFKLDLMAKDHEIEAQRKRIGDLGTLLDRFMAEVDVSDSESVAASFHQ